jgi:hypothetical protein
MAEENKAAAVLRGYVLAFSIGGMAASAGLAVMFYPDRWPAALFVACLLAGVAAAISGARNV